MTKETAEPPPRRGSATAATPTPHHLLWGPNHRPGPAGSTGAEQSADSLLRSGPSTASGPGHHPGQPRGLRLAGASEVVWVFRSQVLIRSPTRR